MTKAEFIQSIRQLIADGDTEAALEFFRTRIVDIDPALVNDALLLESGFNAAKTDFFVKGLLPREDYDRTVARINYALLETLEKIEKLSPLSINRNSGRLLHHIPSKMPLAKETRCIVRIAYDDANLTRDFKTDENTVIQSVKLAEVMDVELLDTNETPAFQIRTISEAEQFIVSDDFTQWIFMVKPLREGTYPLTLKVAVIEEVNGKERRREIVLEKEIVISSQEAPPQYAPEKKTNNAVFASAFESSNYQFNYALSSDDAASAVPSTATKKRFSVGSVMSTLAVMVMALSGYFAYQKFSVPNDASQPTDTEIVAEGGKGKGNKNMDNPNSNEVPPPPPPTSDTTFTPEVYAQKDNRPPINAVPLPPEEPQKPVKSPLPKVPKPNKGTTAATTKTKPSATKPKAQPPTTQPKIELENNVRLTPQEPKVDAVIKVDDGVALVPKTYRVRIKLKGAMRFAEIFVDNQPVKVVKKNLGGTPTMIEFSSVKTMHNIRFTVDGVSCTVENVLITSPETEVEACSFKKK